MKKEKCVSCGKKVEFLGKNNEVAIYKCSSCGLGVTQKTEEDEQYEAYHRDLDYIQNEEQFRNIFRKRISIISKLKNLGKALEVGSSTGLFLSLLKEKGWEVLGIEPSSISSRTAADRGIPTLPTTFELSQLQKNNFDLIVFNHVLEHMKDPLVVLKKANKILKKGGIIFIDVPNFGGFSAKLQGVAWKYILPKEHLWHFTNDSLSRILKKARFSVVYSRTHSGIWDYGNPMLELCGSFKGGKKRFVKDVITALPSFISTILNQGSGLTLVAKKNEI